MVYGPVLSSYCISLGLLAPKLIVLSATTFNQARPNTLGRQSPITQAQRIDRTPKT